MKLCSRCKLRKPDAVFRAKKSIFKRGASCRTPHIGRAGGRKKARLAIRTFQAQPITPSAEDARLIALAKREMKKFTQRGAPVVERPYLFVAGDPAKGLVRKVVHSP